MTGQVRLNAADLPLPEETFQRQIIELAELKGWLVYHTYDSRRSREGFPDLVMVRGETVLFFEVKGVGKGGRRGMLSNAQRGWLQRLRKAVRVFARAVWPDDWSTVEEMLTESP